MLESDTRVERALEWLQIGAPLAIGLAGAGLAWGSAPEAAALLIVTGSIGSICSALANHKLSRALFLQQQLELKARQQRDDFLSVLMHNFKGPLIGATHALEAIATGIFGEVKPDVAKTLDIVKRSDQELLQLTDSLVGVYRLENYQRHLLSERVDVSRAVSRICQEFSDAAKAVDVNLLQLLPDDMALARADRDALDEILTILLNNAISTSPQYATVTLQVLLEHKSIVIEVRDRGCGMSEEDAAALFNQFWRGSKSQPYPAKVGINVYYAFRLAQAMGGSLCCESTPGEGTTFRTTLPAAAPAISLFPSLGAEECSGDRDMAGSSEQSAHRNRH